MAEFIENPRRHPRIAIRCAARLAFRTGGFVGTQTFDLGPGGCGLACPQRIALGEKVFVELRDSKVFGAHLLSGTVAWTAAAAPWRCGIAFDRGSACVAAKLVEQLARAYPVVNPRAPFIERISADALLTPTPVPGRLSAVPVEAEVLSALGPGVDAGTLRARLGDRWAPCVKALFALLGRGAIQVAARRR